MALKLAFLGLKEDDDTRFKLKSAAAHDLLWLWAVQGNEKEALAFIDKQELSDGVAEFKDRQAQEWLRQGAVDKAVAYYEGLMAANPEDVRIPDYHLRLAHAYLAKANIPAMQAQTQALVKLTSDPQNPWYEEHKDEQELIVRAKKMVDNSYRWPRVSSCSRQRGRRKTRRRKTC